MKYVLIALLVTLLAGLFELAGDRRAVSEPRGWKRLRPGVALTAFNMFLLAAAIGAVYLWAINIARYIGGASQSWASLLVPALFVAAAVAWIAQTYATGFRFNDKGIEHRFLSRRKFVRWKDMAEIDCSEEMVAWIRVKCGTGYTVAKGFRGFAQMVRTAQLHDVKVKE